MLCGEEEGAIQEAIDRLKQKDRLAQDGTADLVEVHKKTMKNLRMWLPQGQGHVNVLEGQAIYLDGEAALLSCTGSATLSGTRRPTRACWCSGKGRTFVARRGLSSPCPN